jgi:hypothetical protein
MRSFVDSKKHVWTVALTDKIVGRLKVRLGIDLREATKSPDKISTLLFGDEARLLAILYVLCEPEVKVLGIDEREFAKRMIGAGSGSVKALTEVLLDFFGGKQLAAVKAKAMRFFGK